MKRKFMRILLSFLALAGAVSVSGCNNGPKEPTIGDANWVDYAHNGSIQLTLDYKGKDFYKDGIGEVTLKTHIDGDTAHFYPVVKTTKSDPIKARYYGIDTPESTGRIQEYGQEASDFNHEKLENAKKNGTIVVASPQTVYGAPTPDSTGERYVSLVWISETKKNCPYDELTLLNLEIVQNGLSWAKNVDDMPSYSETFYAAEAQAKSYKLNLFSGKPADKYNYGDYKDCSLLELKIATENHLADRSYVSPWDGAKVRIKGTVAGFCNGTLYLQSFFNEEDSEAIRGEGLGKRGGEYAGINVFCGMSTPDTTFTTNNTYLQISAVAVFSETFGFQLTGAEGHFITYKPKQDDVLILLTADNNQDEQKLATQSYTADQLDIITRNKTFECLNCAVEVTTPVKCKKAIVSSSNEITLAFENYAFEAYITFTFAGDYQLTGNQEDKFKYWVTPEDYVGRKFKLKGVFAYHDTGTTVYYQINLGTSENLTVVPE